jgi:hypothetical protein
MNVHTIDLDVVGWGAGRESARAEVAHFGLAHRLLRALSAVALVWVVAIPLMFIPWFVFTTLPIALALSVFFFVVRIRAPEVAQECRGTCPDCGHVQSFDVPVRFELPLAIECAHCSRELTLKQHIELM